MLSGVMTDDVIGQVVHNCRRTWHDKHVAMAAPRRLRLAMLEQELAQARLQHNMILVALLDETERERQRAPRRRRRWWVRDWILRRPLFGQFETLLRELENEHASDFKSFLRMEPALWHKLLERVGPRITKNQW